MAALPLVWTKITQLNIFRCQSVLTRTLNAQVLTDFLLGKAHFFEIDQLFLQKFALPREKSTQILGVSDYSRNTLYGEQRPLLVRFNEISLSQTLFCGGIYPSRQMLPVFLPGAHF